jgi:regulator of nucleoside diphosphate kinase
MNTLALRMKAVSKSSIVLLAEDHRDLSALVQSEFANLRISHLAERLAEELERAQALANGHLPEQIVCMNCEIEFRNDNAGWLHKMALVYPWEASIEEGRLSVLTPVGTALIGLRVGDSGTWETPAGQTRKLTVVSTRPLRIVTVSDNARAVGEFFLFLSLCALGVASAVTLVMTAYWLFPTN